MSASVMPEPTTPASSRTILNLVGRWTYLAAILMALGLGAILYWPSLAGPRLFDDDVMLSDVDHVETIGELAYSLNWLRPETRPLVRFTFVVEAFLFGDSMSVHRLGNIAIHVFAAMALFGLVRRVCQQIEKGYADSSFSVASQTAFAVSLLWFVHPLQSAAVAYVAQRGESLMGLFFFLYLRCLVELITTRNARWLFAAIVVFCLGLYSKTIMISVPLVGLLLDRAFFARSWKAVFRGQWGLMLVPAAGSVIAVGLLLPGILKGQANVGFGGDAPPIDLHLAAQAKVLWLYVFQCIWPRWLSVDHALRPPLYISDQIGWMLLSSILLLAIAALYWQRKYAAWFLMLSPLCVLAMTSSVIPTADLWVDHRMYVPLACMMTILVWGLRTILNRLQGPLQTARFLPWIVCVICLLFSARTWVRAGDYCSGMQIWRSAIAENPDNDRAMQGVIGHAREESPGRPVLSVLSAALRAAEETGVVPTVALGRLGEQYAELGESQRAINLLTRAIRLDDQYFFDGYRGGRRNSERFGMQINMGLSLASLGQLPDALEQIGQAFLYGDSADARALAGSLALQLGETSVAQGHFERALELRPGWKDVEADLERLRPLQ